MQIERGRLAAYLDAARPGLPQKNGTFVFWANRLYTFNHDVLMVIPLGGHLFDAEIPADELLAVINKTKSSALDVDFDDMGNMLFIKHGRAKSGIAIAIDSDDPIDIIIDEYKSLADMVCDVPENAFKAIDRARQCAGKQDDAILGVVQIKQDYVSATDTYIIYREFVEWAEWCDQESILLPIIYIKHLIKFNPVEMRVGKNWLFFMNNDKQIFACRLNSTNSKYPNIDSVLDIKGTSFTFPDGTLDAIDAASAFIKLADDQVYRTVVIDVSDDILTVRGEGPHGFHEEKIKFKDSNNRTLDFSFITSPDLLKTILPNTHEVIVGERSLLFSGHDFLYACVKMIGA